MRNKAVESFQMLKNEQIHVRGVDAFRYASLDIGLKCNVDLKWAWL